MLKLLFIPVISTETDLLQPHRIQISNTNLRFLTNIEMLILTTITLTPSYVRCRLSSIKFRPQIVAQHLSFLT